MTGAPDVRALTAADTSDFGAAIDRAIAAGDLLASSDPPGAFVMKAFALDPGRCVGAFEGGELVGFASSDIKIAVVRPDRRRRGIGRALVDAAAARPRAKGEAQLLMGVLPGEPVGPQFLAALGFAYHSTVWDLDLPSDRAVAPPTWPEGLVARPFAGAADVEAWVRVFNAAFHDHPTPLQLDAAFAAAALDDPDNHNGDVVLLAEGPNGDLVGFCATDPQRRTGRVSSHGEIWAVGVRPDRQGRGLGRQLVRAGIARLRSIGVTDVALAVNARNESALGLYESEGFVRSRTRDRWARPVGPGTGAGT